MRTAARSAAVQTREPSPEGSRPARGSRICGASLTCCTASGTTGEGPLRKPTSGSAPPLLPVIILDAADTRCLGFAQLLADLFDGTEDAHEIAARDLGDRRVGVA